MPGDGLKYQTENIREKQIDGINRRLPDLLKNATEPELARLLKLIAELTKTTVNTELVELE
jgi:hypothetical protein